MDSVARLLNGLLMLAAPLALGAFIARRTKAPWGLYTAGAVGFFISQALHIPFNAGVLAPFTQRLGFGPGGSWAQAAAWAGLLGLSAGVFEESTRYAVFRFWKRKARDWRQALMLGAGHGGLEALLLGGLVLLAFFQALAYRRADLSGLVPPAQLPLAEARLEAYWSTAWHLSLLGAVERGFALCVHLSLSVLVLQAVRGRPARWMALAIGWHALVDAAALLGLQAWGPLGAEAAIGLLAAGSLTLVFRLKDRPGAAGQAAPQSHPGAFQHGLQEWRPSADSVEQSRYVE